MKTQLVLLLILTFASLNSCSQSREGEKAMEETHETESEFQVPDEYIKDKIVIYNSSGEEVSFYLGESIEELEKFKLKPYRSRISYSYSKGPLFIIYTSNEVFSKYALELGGEYKIYYNTGEKKWDLKRIITVNP